MKDSKQEKKSIRTSTVQYSNRPNYEHGRSFHATGYTEFPRISIAGLWLEELGFHIGDKLQAECGEGYLHISLAEVGMVCEDTPHYETSKESSGKQKKSRKREAKHNEKSE